eukprot:8161753-Prorocentrum_lima.AAC.1
MPVILQSEEVQALLAEAVFAFPQAQELLDAQAQFGSMLINASSKSGLEAFPGSHCCHCQHCQLPPAIERAKELFPQAKGLKWEANNQQGQGST